MRYKAKETIGDLGDPNIGTSTLSSNSPSRSTPIHYEEVLSTAAARLAVSSPMPCHDEIDNDAHSGTSSHPSHRPPSLAASAVDEAVLLSSLPQRPVANFPSEGDRKRVLGCLAAIISMMYEYESWDEKEMNHSIIAHPSIQQNKRTLNFKVVVLVVCVAAISIVVF